MNEALDLTVNEERNTKIFTQTRDLPISIIKEMIDEGDIIPQPTYQREYVIDYRRASKLIESLLIQFPIPPIYLCEEDDGRMSVIDGQQRINAIVRFLNNRFALSGLEELNSINGKYFKDLDKSIQGTLKATTLNSIVILKASHELKYELLERLNQGSIDLRPQEIRDYIYGGTFNDMLDELARNPLLKILYRDENKRKNYQEYILRFFALRNVEDYKSSLKKTFNDYMSNHQNISKEEIQSYKENFTSTMDTIMHVLGDQAFCAYDIIHDEWVNTFSGSVYDSIVGAFVRFDSHDLMLYAEKIRIAIEKVKKNNKQYYNFIYAFTGYKDRIIGINEIIYQAIVEIIGK